MSGDMMNGFLWGLSIGTLLWTFGLMVSVWFIEYRDWRREKNWCCGKEETEDV